MRFSQVSLMLTSVMGLSQGLVLPKTSRAAESRDASTQLNEIFARVSSCGKEDMTQCTACPDIIVPASSTKRDVVPMNGIGHGEWKAGETIETHGLSVCTVIAVWDEEHWIMAHIPPAREGNNGELAATNEELINEYLAKADDRWNNYTWDRPSPNDLIQGSGNLVLSREGADVILAVESSVAWDIWRRFCYLAVLLGRYAIDLAMFI